MRTYGIESEYLKAIRALLSKHFGDIPKVKVYLFGSRSTGEHKRYSDIDLAVSSRKKIIAERIALFKEDWDNSNIPYTIDIAKWSELYKPYLKRIKKSRIPFWEPEAREIHPWRTCPYGEHWVVRHPRYPMTRQMQDVDGHCRKNRSGRDLLKGDEIEIISKSRPFLDVPKKPCSYQGKPRIASADAYDDLIAGWCHYWNDIFKPDIPIHPTFIKALIESESTFNERIVIKTKQDGHARGLIQITDTTRQILGDRQGEIKDHYLDLSTDEILDPSSNICAGIRWMFRKREILQKRLGRSPTWVETVVEYKGLGKQLKANGQSAREIMNNFNRKLENYPCT